jgi:hypothetical protein
MILMVMSWCPGQTPPVPCDPCPTHPPPGNYSIVVPSTIAQGWQSLLCGDAYTLAWYGTSPGGTPYTGPAYPGYIPKAPPNDPVVKYSLTLGAQDNIRVTVGGQGAGILSGSHSTTYVLQYSGQVLSDVILPPPVDPAFPTSPVLVRTQQNCNSYQFNIAIPNGTFFLDPTKGALYRSNNYYTDPIVAPGGPVLAITHP